MGIYVSGLSENRNSKVTLIDLTDTVNEIIELQKTNPIASLALSKTALATSLISISLKENPKVLVNVNGKGFLGRIIAEYENRNIRCHVQNPNFDISKIDRDSKQSALSQSVGVEGYLNVSRQLGDNKPYTSEVELISGEINIDFMYYLQQSDQIHSLISSAVKIDDKGKVEKAVGIIIQLLPDFKDEDIDFLEEKVGSLDHLNKTMLESKNYQALLKDIFDDFKHTEDGEILFKCTCNLEKVMLSVKSLGYEELKKVVEAKGEIEVVCDFCKKPYLINYELINTLLN